jgi:hypothetical protein
VVQQSPRTFERTVLDYQGLLSLSYPLASVVAKRTVTLLRTSLSGTLCSLFTTDSFKIASSARLRTFLCLP